MVPGKQCVRCGHQWVPKDQNRTPKYCPGCHSIYYAEPRRKTKASAKN